MARTGLSPGQSWRVGEAGTDGPRLCRATVDHSHLLSLHQETLLVFKPLRRNDLGRRKCPSFMIHQVWCLAGVVGWWWGRVEERMLEAAHYLLSLHMETISICF